MTTDPLLEHLVRLVTQSNDAGAFRRLVVGLAIRGRLASRRASPPRPQSATPAGLGNAYANERPDRSQSGLDKRIPAALRGTCEFTCLGDLAVLEKGRTGIQGARPGAYPLVVTAEHRLSCDHYDFDAPAAIIPLISSTGHGIASLHRLHYQEGRFALGTILCAVMPYEPGMMSARFLFEYLTAYKDELLTSQMTGTANVTLSMSRIRSTPIPLVAPTAQRRVAELMVAFDELSRARERSEAIRDRASVAALHDLRDGQLPVGEFRQKTTWFLRNSDRLIQRPEQIRELEDAIVDLAVRTRLTTSSARPERRTVSWKRSFTADLPRLGLPSDWHVDSLGDVTKKVTDGAHKTPTYVSHGVPFVSTKDFSGGRLSLTSARRIPESEHEVLYRRCDPRRGDVLIGRIGTLGRPVIVDVDVEFSLFVSVGLIRPNEEIVTPQFLRLFLSSPLAMTLFDQIKIGGGTHTDKLNLADLKGIPILVPPLSEQERIVSRVARLTQRCSELRQALLDGQQIRSRLFEAMITRALAQAA